MMFDLLIFWTFLSSWIHKYIKRWTRPAAVSIAAGSLFDLTRSRTDLLADCAACHAAPTTHRPQAASEAVLAENRHPFYFFSQQPCLEYTTNTDRWAGETLRSRLAQ